MDQPPVFRAVSRPTLYVEVAGQIRAAILDGTIPSGERLPSERELSRQFRVSRASVREALRHLQAQGLLAARGRTAPLETAGSDEAGLRFREALTHVARLQGVSIGDLVELRIAVEGAALLRAAASPIAFHLALVTAGGNQALRLVMQAVKDAIRAHLDQELSARTLARLRPRIVAEHRALLRSVERGAGQAAVAQLRRHLREFYAT
jgi:DNA-binding FadR family transcriptional regulator